jgi:photosystem II stability/assembly factor-like uncharacterized protein
VPADSGLAVPIELPMKNKDGKSPMSTTLLRRLLHPAAIALLAAASTLTSFPGVAQTAFTTGGVEVRGFLARSSTTVYAAAYGGGLYKSTDSGATWTRVDMPANERYLTSVAGNSASYMVVGAEEGLLRSADGTTFTRTLFEPVAAVAVAPGTSLVVLAGLKGVGVVRSTDGGVTFNPANNAALDSLDVTALVFDPSNASVAYVSTRPDGAGSRGGVFKSSDGGATWAALAAPASKYVTSLAVDTSGNLYASVLRPSDGGGDIYQLASGSSFWSSGTSDPFGAVSLHRDANSGFTIWAGSRYLGLRKGSGTSFPYTFAGDTNPNILYTSINAVATFPGNSSIVLKAIKGAGVWRSTVDTSQRTWTRVSFPGADRVLSATGVAGSATTVLAGLYAGGVWRSTNSGASFSPPTVNAGQADFSFAGGATSVAPFVSIWELSASATNPNVVYAAAGGVGMFYSNDNPGLFRFNGTSWGGVGNNVPAGAPWNGNTESGIALNVQQVYGVAVNTANDAVAYTSYLTPGGVFTRSGTNWTQVVPPGVTAQVRSVVLASSISSKQLALPFDDKATLSTNSGASYTQVTASQTGFERLRFFSAAENPSNSQQWIGGTNKGVFRSVDGGTSWNRVAAGSIFKQYAITAVGFRSGTAFAGDWDGNRYCSTDGGATWKSAGTKLRAGVNAIRTIGSSLYYLTDGAGYFREDGTCA